MCIIIKRGPYLDIDYEEFQNLNFVQSDNEQDNAKFSVINPLTCLIKNLENSDRLLSNAPVAPTIIDSLYF